MPKFAVQETHPGSRPVFVYSIVDDDVNTLAAAIMANRDRGWLSAELDGESHTIGPDETEKWLRKGARVSVSRWYGNTTIVFRNTMRLAVEAETREDADEVVMVEISGFSRNAEDGDERAAETSDDGLGGAGQFTGNPTEQVKLEKFRSLIVSSGLIDEVAMSGGDVSVELESDEPLSFKFMLPASVRHRDIMERPCGWAAEFGADEGTVEFGRDGSYHAIFTVT